MRNVQGRKVITTVDSEMAGIVSSYLEMNNQIAVLTEKKERLREEIIKELNAVGLDEMMVTDGEKSKYRVGVKNRQRRNLNKEKLYELLGQEKAETCFDVASYMILEVKVIP